MPIDPRMKNPRSRTGIWSTVRHVIRYPDVLVLRGSVLWSVMPIIICSTLYTAGICWLYIVKHKDVTLPGSLIGSVAIVIGLLLAFRTNNAYDRYYEGRKLFSNLCTIIRNSSRIVWIGFADSTDEDYKEKLGTVRMLLAYAVAVKHHLRLEFGAYWFDLEDLLPSGFQQTAFDGNADQEQQPGTEGYQPPKPHVHVYLPEYATRLPPIYGSLSNEGGTSSQHALMYEWGTDADASMSLPLEIIYHLNLKFDEKLRDRKLDAGRYGTLIGNLNSMCDVLGSLERIGNTPIPYAYNIHLKQAVILYVWTLPLTLVEALGWLTVPTIFAIASVMFGVEGIGAEIENPFGYDKNDLPLDAYCKDLESEIRYLETFMPQRTAVRGGP